MIRRLLLAWLALIALATPLSAQTSPALTFPPLTGRVVDDAHLLSDAQNRVSASIIPFQRMQEAYPDLKSNTNFLTLQSQIEGTENSILVSRKDYNEAVQAYNTRIRTFPDAIGAKIFYGAKPKVMFQGSSGSQNAPKVDFGQ